MLRVLRKNGQNTIEFTVLIIIVLGALLATGNYFKRGLQGRWKTAVDELGDQYDPRTTNSNVTVGISGETQTRITALPAANGLWTMRVDVSNSVETKTGSMTVGAF